MVAKLKALDQVQERAFEMGVTLAQPTAADVLSQRGVLVSSSVDEDAEALAKTLQSGFTDLLNAFIAMRAAEGAHLADVILEQLAQIEGFVGQAAETLKDRAADQEASLKKALLAVKDTLGDVDEGRIAQELAIIAVKADVTEELDRLTAHIAAARALVASKEPAGRKLDFLAQEFNREANTLCSKAQSKVLTSIGLDLKAVIDQMREQIQNVE